MKRRQNYKAFSLIDLAVTLLVVSVLATLGIVGYKKTIKKAKNVEAVVAAGTIRTAEIAHELKTKEFVPAENTVQVNDKLGLSLPSKDFAYRVVGVTADNFLILAYRIDENIEEGKFSSDAVVVAMDKNGFVPWESSGGGSGSSSGSGAESSSGSGSGSGSSSAGSSSGGSSSGSSGSSSGDSSGGSGSGDGTTTSSPVVDTGVDLAAAVALLEGTDNGDWGYVIIDQKDINVEYLDMDESIYGLWVSTWYLDFVPDSEYVPNTIYINSDIKNTWSKEAIAAVIVHECLHVDYNYNMTADWADVTATAYGVPLGALNWEENPVTHEDVLLDSIDQEYNAFCREALFWNEVKGENTNEELDFVYSLYDQGGTELYDAVAATYDYLPLYAQGIKG
jgi:type II secretory pathway pseudopilin PulG